MLVDSFFHLKSLTNFDYNCFVKTNYRVNRTYWERLYSKCNKEVLIKFSFISFEEQ